MCCFHLRKISFSIHHQQGRFPTASVPYDHNLELLSVTRSVLRHVLPWTSRTMRTCTTLHTLTELAQKYHITSSPLPHESVSYFHTSSRFTHLTCGCGCVCTTTSPPHESRAVSHSHIPHIVHLFQINTGSNLYIHGQQYTYSTPNF